MVDILHRVGIRGERGEIFTALSTIGGLSGWWTNKTSGNTEVGGVIQFRFTEGGPDMKVEESVANERVVWRCIAGPDEWIDTRLTFDIKESEGETVVLFGHRGWEKPVEFMSHCSSKWAYFLFSLKALIETGKGTPSPDDMAISAWG